MQRTSILTVPSLISFLFISTDDNDLVPVKLRLLLGFYFKWGYRIIHHPGAGDEAQGGDAAAYFQGEVGVYSSTIMAILLKRTYFGTVRPTFEVAALNKNRAA